MTRDALTSSGLREESALEADASSLVLRGDSQDDRGVTGEDRADNSDPEATGGVEGAQGAAGVVNEAVPEIMVIG
jgi:hypothetical protein